MFIYYKNKYRIYAEYIYKRPLACVSVKLKCQQCPLFSFCIYNKLSEDIFLNEIIVRCSKGKLVDEDTGYLFIKNISPINMYKLLL